MYSISVLPSVSSNKRVSSARYPSITSLSVTSLIICFNPVLYAVAIAAFPKDVLPAQKEWIEKHYPVVQYTQMPRGGHFTALEQPKEFAEDIKNFVAKLK